MWSLLGRACFLYSMLPLHTPLFPQTQKDLATTFHLFFPTLSHQVLTLLITSMTSRVMILIWATMINPFYQISSTIIQVQISLSYLPAYTASMSSHWLTSYQGLWDPCMPHLFPLISINSRVQSSKYSQALACLLLFQPLRLYTCHSLCWNISSIILLVSSPCIHPLVLS